MASIRAGKNNLFFLKNNTPTAVNDIDVWPDGKLKSMGLFIKSSIDVFIWQGLILPTIGFRRILQTITFIARDIIIAKPIFLVFLDRSRHMDRIIHIIPRLANFVIGGII